MSSASASPYSTNARRHLSVIPRPRPGVSPPRLYPLSRFHGPMLRGLPPFLQWNIGRRRSW